MNVPLTTPCGSFWKLFKNLPVYTTNETTTLSWASGLTKQFELTWPLYTTTSTSRLASWTTL